MTYICLCWHSKCKPWFWTPYRFYCWLILSPLYCCCCSCVNLVYRSRKWFLGTRSGCLWWKTSSSWAITKKGENSVLVQRNLITKVKDEFVNLKPFSYKLLAFVLYGFIYSCPLLLCWLFPLIFSYPIYFITHLNTFCLPIFHICLASSCKIAGPLRALRAYRKKEKENITTKSESLSEQEMDLIVFSPPEDRKHLCAFVFLQSRLWGRLQDCMEKRWQFLATTEPLKQQTSWW